MGNKCAHCKKRAARETWTLDLCAMENKKLTGELCRPCDIELNRMVMEFFNVPDAQKLAEAYIAKVMGG